MGIVLVAAAFASGSETARRPNHRGVVVVGEWHHIAAGRTPYHCSPKTFLGQLKRLDRLGFRPVTAREWLSGSMRLDKGTSPVVMTFDDSYADQFRILDDGSVDPKCGMGLWLSYAKAHPDFPVKATFFAVPTMMWGQPRWKARKLQLLHEWGGEIANHTIDHPDLSRVGDARVAQEIGAGDAALRRLGEKGPFDFAYPYGAIPRRLGIMRGFRYMKRRVTVASAFLAGAKPSPMPGARGFSRYLIPRIQAIRGPYGLDDWLTKIEKGKVKPYVQ